MSTANLSIDQLEAGQSLAELTLNDGVINFVDAFLGGRSAIDQTDSPPGSPTNGSVYIVGSSPTGAWSGHANEVAFYYDGWRYLPTSALTGFRLWIVSQSRFRTWNGAAWVASDVQDASGNFTVTGNLILEQALQLSIEAGLTAYAGGGQGSALELSATKIVHEVTTVASSGDSVKLPAPIASRLHIVINHGNADLAVFPQTGHSIANESANDSVSVAPGKLVIFSVATATRWGASEVLSAGAAPITPATFSAVGELIVGAGASSFSVLAVPSTNPSKRLLVTDGSKNLSWEHAQKVFAQVNSAGAGTVAESSRNWLRWTELVTRGPGITYNDTKGRWEFDASTFPDLVGDWEFHASFFGLSNEGNGIVSYAAVHRAGSGGAFTNKALADYNQGAGAISSMIGMHGVFQITASQVDEFGIEALAGGSGPHGGGNRHLYNQIQFRKVFPQ